ncbi:MAG: cadherin repeat domain-containing protein [Algicola sp.]|nr:cadherin repeat domain-containing protein [Algicola sp.]
MKYTNLTFIYTLAVGFLFVSCSDDGEDTENPIPEATIEITAQDVTITMDEVTQIQEDESLELSLATLADYISVEGAEGVEPEFSIKSQSVDGAFSIEGDNLILNDKSILDFETNPEFTAVVTVVVGDESKDLNVTLTLNDVHEATWSIGPIEVGMYENPENNEQLLIVAISNYNPELDGEVTVTLSEQSPANALRTEGRALLVNDASLFDFETNPTITAKFTVADANGRTEENMITISLIDVAETSWTVENATFTIDEHPDSGTVIGNIAPTLTDSNIVLSYSISQFTPDLLLIDTNGDVIVNHGYLMDYETGDKAATVTITDNQGNSQDIFIVVHLNNIQEPQWGFNVTSQGNITVNENLPNGNTLAVFSQYIVDYREGVHGNISYSLANESVPGALRVTGQGLLQVNDASAFDYETNPTITATLKGTDQRGTTNSVPITITLNDLNELSLNNISAVISSNSSPGDVAFVPSVYLDGVRIANTDLANNYVVTFSDYKINGQNTASSILELNNSGQVVLLNVLGSQDNFTAIMTVTDAQDQNITVSANVLVRF